MASQGTPGKCGRLHIICHAKCRKYFDALRPLIAKGNVNQLPLAEHAIKEYLEATPASARRCGLRLLQQAILAQRNDLIGDQRNFPDIVNIYIDNKLSE
jgi:hypothetical protein